MNEPLLRNCPREPAPFTRLQTTGNVLKRALARAPKRAEDCSEGKSATFKRGQRRELEDVARDRLLFSAPNRFFVTSLGNEKAGVASRERCSGGRSCLSVRARSGLLRARALSPALRRRRDEVFRGWPQFPFCTALPPSRKSGQLKPLFRSTFLGVYHLSFKRCSKCVPPFFFYKELVSATLSVFQVRVCRGC